MKGRDSISDRSQGGEHVKNHHLLTQLLCAGELDGECYPLTTSKAGSELARTALRDDYHRLHHGLLLMLQKPNTQVWVRQKGWEDPANHQLEFFAFSSPENLRHFRKVWLLGDEARKSLTAKVWEKRWNVRFEEYDFKRRVRAVPTASRLTIYYFSEHRDASLSRFRKNDLPLEGVSAWIAANAGEPVLWTANLLTSEKVKLPPGDYVSPRAHGRNDLMHYRQVAWLCAMKASPFEVTTLRDVLGVTASEISAWRELNAMYQFVMRGDLRRFESHEQNVIYVFSKVQAEYLHERLGGTIRHVPGVVQLDVPNPKPPRKKALAGTAMTSAEKTAASRWRKRMADAGVADVRDLKGHEKLDERMIGIVNSTFEKKAA